MKQVRFIEITGSPGVGKTTLKEYAYKKTGIKKGTEFSIRDHTNYIFLVVEFFFFCLYHIKFIYLIFINYESNSKKLNLPEPPTTNLLTTIIHITLVFFTSIKEIKISKKIKQKIILKDEPLFQTIYNYKFFYSEFKEISSLLKYVNKHFYSKYYIENIHLYDDIENIINKRKKRKGRIDNVNIKTIEKQTQKYKRNVTRFRQKINYSHEKEIDVENKSVEEVAKKIIN